MAWYEPKNTNFDPQWCCGQAAARILGCLMSAAQPGISTYQIRELFDEECANYGVSSAMLGVNGFPAPLAISVSPTICGGVPGSSRILASGDIMNMDMAVSLNGWITDTAASVLVGPPSRPGDPALLAVAHEALRLGIRSVRPKVALAEIARAIETYVEQQGYCLLQHFDGHGVGRALHQAPRIAHTLSHASDEIASVGMVFTIEPVLADKPSTISYGSDGWSRTLEPNVRCAWYEHTVRVTEHGAEVLTIIDDAKPNFAALLTARPELR